MFEKYLKHIGLEILIPHIKDVELNSIVEQAFYAPLPNLSEEEIKDLYVYVVPEISPDGSCSIIEKPADKPYNLAETFQLIPSSVILNKSEEFSQEDSSPTQNDKSEFFDLTFHPHTIRLWRLKQIVKNIFALTDVDWFGIYRKVQNVHNDWVLAKESYKGLFSRPEFPLTKEFAKKSNNTTVGLTGKAKVIQDVYNSNGPYYKCDGKVQSEFCLPILGEKNNVIGIIDAESFPKNFFTNKRLLQIAKVGFDLGQRNLGV